MSEATLTLLERLALSLSSKQRQVSPMQVAALLVEEGAESYAKSLTQEASRQTGP